MTTRPPLDWSAATGCSPVAIHCDVDAIDSNEVGFGLGREPDGLTGAEARRVVSDVSGAVDVVGMTIGEYFPGQVMQLLRSLEGFALQ